MVMDEQARLAALAVIELAMRHARDPSRPEDRLEELDVLLADVDPERVMFEIAAVLVGITQTWKVPLDKVIEDMRRHIVGGL